MEVLDGDVVRLSSRGREAERDIVQVSARDLVDLHLMHASLMCTDCVIDLRLIVTNLQLLSH